MAENIVPTQTSVPGVELIYLKDQDVAGIHGRGLAKLLGCPPMTIQRLVEGVTFEHLLEVEIQTGGGIQGVTFILESGVIQILKAIRRSGRIKQTTKDAAEDLYDRFAVAGFKLYTMLKVAPEALKEKVDRHVEELEVLRMRQEVLKLEKELLDKRDWIVRTLPEPQQQKILGYATIERVEYRDRVIHNDDIVNDGSTTTKSELCHRYKFLTRNGKPDYRKLNAYLEQLPSEAFDTSVRFLENNELRRDWIPQLDRLIDCSDRNLYIGE